MPRQDDFGRRPVYHREHDRLRGRQVTTAASLLAELWFRRTLEIRRTLHKVCRRPS